MDIGVISVRYARALLSAAMDAKVEDKVYGDMAIVSKNYIDFPQLRRTVDNPMLSKEKKGALLIAAAGKKPTALTKTFIQMVVEADRADMMQFIANSYITLYRKEKNIVSGKLTTATPVSHAVEQKMRKMVENETNGNVEFEIKSDPDIIGGFILEYDTYRMDASVKSRLNAILTHLSK